MTERQFRRVLENGAWRRSRPLGECGVDALLRDAARDVRRREAAQAAWLAIAPPELRDRARVDSLREGRLRLRPQDATTHQKLLRASAKLLTQIRRRLRDVREIVALPPGQADIGEPE